MSDKHREITDDDYEMLKAFVQSPVFPVFQSVLEDSVKSLHTQLELASEMKQMFNLQGRINGIRYCQNVVRMLVEDHIKRKQDKARAERLYGNKK